MRRAAWSAFSGRALALPPPGDEDRARDPPPKYINSPESPIYIKGRDALRPVAGTPCDSAERSRPSSSKATSTWSVCTRGASPTWSAPLGTAFTVDQAKLLRRYAIDVTLLFDGDAAGRKAAPAAEDPCDKAGIDAKVALLPETRSTRTNSCDARAPRRSSTRSARPGACSSTSSTSSSTIPSTRPTCSRERVAHRARRRDPRAAERSRGAGHAQGVRRRVRRERLDLVRSQPNAFGALKRKVPDAGRATRVYIGPRPSEARVKPRAPGQRGAQGHRRGDAGFSRTSR